MELNKIRNLTDEELKDQGTKSAEQLFLMRFQKSLGNSEGVKKLRGLKLDISRIKTVARERELAADQADKKPVAVAAPAASARKKAKKD